MRRPSLNPLDPMPEMEGLLPPQTLSKANHSFLSSDRIDGSQDCRMFGNYWRAICTRSNCYFCVEARNSLSF